MRDLGAEQVGGGRLARQQLDDVALRPGVGVRDTTRVLGLRVVFECAADALDGGLLGWAFSAASE
ncbi:hypothetical protein ACFWBS_55970 [Streptomyces mirabilis]|uniref:hypothetical protein n=1 Tax=Streptomyces mirabilis TaxID=68239 RepID=UPI00365C87A3